MSTEIILAFIVALMAVMDLGMAYLFIHRAIINHLRNNTNRPLLVAFSLIFAAEAIGEVSQIAHLYQHFNIGEPTHHWLIFPYLLELTVKGNLFIVFKTYDKYFGESDLNIFAKKYHT